MGVEEDVRAPATFFRFGGEFMAKRWKGASGMHDQDKIGCQGNRGYRRGKGLIRLGRKGCDWRLKRGAFALHLGWTAVARDGPTSVGFLTFRGSSYRVLCLWRRMEGWLRHRPDLGLGSYVYADRAFLCPGKYSPGYKEVALFESIQQCCVRAVARLGTTDD